MSSGDIDSELSDFFFDGYDTSGTEGLADWCDCICMWEGDEFAAVELDSDCELWMCRIEVD